MNAKSIKVRDIMNSNVIFIDKNSSIISAGNEMIEKHVSSFIIKPDNDLDAFGIITRKDVVEALVTTDIEDTSVLVKDIMTKPILTIDPELSIYICHQMMLMVGVRRLPVVENRQLIGIISNSDILNNFVRTD
jgi:CBS domain-containing protein